MTEQDAERAWQECAIGLFRSESLGVVVVDAGGRLAASNESFLRLLGYEDVSDLVGASMEEVCQTPPTADAFSDVRFVRRDGSEVGGRVMACSAEGSRTLWIVAGHDDARPSPLMGELAAALAHEVRNPLAGIRGAVEVIGDRMPPAAPEQAILRAIAERTTQVQSVIDDLVVYARPERPRFERLSLRACVDRARDVVAADAGSPAHSVVIEGDDIEIDGDAKLLEIAFGNLLRNARQATPAHGSVEVVLGRHEDHATVTVDDDGPGVEGDERRRVFEAFFTTRARGVGLGLTTARRILEDHGGTLAVGPSAKGASFIAAIPLRQPTTA